MAINIANLKVKCLALEEQESATWKITSPLWLLCWLHALLLLKFQLHGTTAFAVNEEKAIHGQIIQLMTDHKAEAVRAVQRLHRNLGHPTTIALVEMLESRFFFRPTPLGFRQVVQHVQLHVA